MYEFSPLVIASYNCAVFQAIPRGENSYMPQKSRGWAGEANIFFGIFTFGYRLLHVTLRICILIFFISSSLARSQQTRVTSHTN